MFGCTEKYNKKHLQPVQRFDTSVVIHLLFEDRVPLSFSCVSYIYFRILFLVILFNVYWHSSTNKRQASCCVAREGSISLFIVWTRGAEGASCEDCCNVLWKVSFMDVSMIQPSFSLCLSDILVLFGTRRLPYHYWLHLKYTEKYIGVHTTIRFCLMFSNIRIKCVIMLGNSLI